MRRESACDPERARQLVDRDRRPRVGRAVEEVVQAHRHAARRPAVERLDVDLVDAPGVGEAASAATTSSAGRAHARLVGGGAPEAPGLLGAPARAQARPGAGGERRRRRDCVALLRLCDIGANGQRGLPAGHCRRARPGRPGLRRWSDDDLHAQARSRRSRRRAARGGRRRSAAPSRRRRARRARRPAARRAGRTSAVALELSAEGDAGARRRRSARPSARALVDLHRRTGQLGEAQLGVHLEEPVLQPRVTAAHRPHGSWGGC